MDDHGHDDANQAAVEGHAPVQILKEPQWVLEELTEVVK